MDDRDDSDDAAIETSREPLGDIAAVEELTEEIPAALVGERLDRVVALVADLARAGASELIASGAVWLDGVVRTARAERVQLGQVLRIQLPPGTADITLSADPTIDLTIVYEDDDVVVVDKQEGLVVHPGAGHAEGTMVHGLLARYPAIARVGEEHRPGIVHRLDRGTSGLLVVARTQPAYDGLVQQLRDHQVQRSYDALVWGHLDVARGMVDAPIGRSRRRRTAMAVAADGREARTRYEVQRAWWVPVACSLLRCDLETGRTHQIRVHLAAIGHPVVGDDRYGGDRQSLRAKRPLLHAARLAFMHPTSGASMTFDAPRASDFQGVIDTLSSPVA